VLSIGSFASVASIMSGASRFAVMSWRARQAIGASG
jgi:hypothetical protein